MFALDPATLHWCTFVTSTTFAALFAYDWVVRGRARHLLLAGASFAIYALALAGLAVVGQDVLGRSLLCGLLGLNTALILLAVRAFDGERLFHAPALAIPFVTALAYALPALLPPAFSPLLLAQVANSAALAGATSFAAWRIGRRRRTRAPRAQSVVALVLVAYLPAYAVSIAMALAGGDGGVLALVPMLSDQVLLPVLGLALLGMMAERDAGALRDAALRDPLTGAWNRAGLLRLERRVPPRAGVVLIDVDRFKSVNDRHGHAAGDAVLVALARGVRALLPPGGALVRLGGDEFLALCPSEAEAHTLAAAVLPLGRAGSPGWSVSIGVAVRDPDEQGLAAAIARADTCLYRAKEAGRDRLAA